MTILESPSIEDMPLPYQQEAEVIDRALHDGTDRDGRRRPNARRIVEKVDDPAKQLNVLEKAAGMGGSSPSLLSQILSASSEELDVFRRLLGTPNLNPQVVKESAKSEEMNFADMKRTVKQKHQMEEQRTFFAFDPANPLAAGFTLEINDVEYKIEYMKPITHPQSVYLVLLEMGRTQPQTAADQEHFRKWGVKKAGAVEQARQMAEHDEYSYLAYAAAQGIRSESGIVGVPTMPALNADSGKDGVALY